MYSTISEPVVCACGARAMVNESSCYGCAVGPMLELRSHVMAWVPSWADTVVTR